MSVVHIREPFDVFIGRPSHRVKLNIVCSLSENFRVVLHKTDTDIALFTEGTPKITSGMVMIPTEVFSGATDLAITRKHDFSTSTISLFIDSGSFVSVFSTAPPSILSMNDVNDTTSGAKGRFCFCIDLRQNVLPTNRLNAFGQSSVTKKPVVTGNTETPDPEWFITTNSRTQITANRRRYRSHIKYNSISNINNQLQIFKPFKWGNPYLIGRDGNREEVIALYRAYLLDNKELMDSLDELKGKVLGCYCKPQACHGDVLDELANKD